jgi:hypothetical protein
MYGDRQGAIGKALNLRIFRNLSDLLPLLIIMKITDYFVGHLQSRRNIVYKI